MKTNNKQKVFQNYKTLLRVVIIIIIVKKMMLLNGNYPFKMNKVEFFIDTISTLIIFGGIYFILRHIYSKRN